MTLSHRLYLMALLGTPCAVLLVLAAIYFPWYAWLPFIVSAAPVLSQAIQVWFRRPVLANAEIEREEFERHRIIKQSVREYELRQLRGDIER